MKINKYCNDKAILITLSNDIKILYSYETPVAIFKQKWIVTQDKEVLTTTTYKHIEQITGMTWEELEKIDIYKYIEKI